MKVENGVVFQGNGPLLVLLQMEWPVKVSYALAKLAHKLGDQFNIINDVRQGLVRKYGSEDEHRQVVVKEGTEDYRKFLVEYEELMSQEVELVIEKVVLPAEADGKPMMVAPATLMPLEQFVEVG